MHDDDDDTDDDDVRITVLIILVGLGSTGVMWKATHNTTTREWTLQQSEQQVQVSKTDKDSSPTNQVLHKGK